KNRNNDSARINISQNEQYSKHHISRDMKQKKGNQYKEILNQLIVDIFEKSNNQPLNYKQIAAKLNLRDNDAKVAIGEILSDESKSGKFMQIDRGKFKLRIRNVYVHGRVDMTADGSAYIVPKDEFENDIYIAPRKLRHALHNDIVKVHVYQRKNKRPREGEVVEIIERAKM